MVLMLITFFLVIGFGIGALSTMNLNLSARSVNTVKANKLAEGAVAAFINYVETKSSLLNQSVPIDDMSFPPLNLDLWYNGARNIFDPWKGYMGDNCNVDVHFNKPAGDRYYSTDNSGNRDARTDGAYGYVPPFTIDLIVTAKVGNFTKHYQVWISRKWDFAIYNQNGPVHLLSSYDMSLATPTPLRPSSVEGNIFSKFYPPDFSGHPQYLMAFEMYCSSDHDVSENFIIRNWMPGKNYPASTTLGANTFIKKCSCSPSSTVAVVDYFHVDYSRNNTINGRGAFEFPPPTPSPPPDIFVYSDNTIDSSRSNIYNQRLLSPFDHLQLVNPDTVLDNMNPDKYPDYIEKDDALDNKDAGGKRVGPYYTYTVSNPDGCTNVDTPPADMDLTTYYQTLAEWSIELNEKHPVYFLKKSFTLSPTSEGRTKFAVGQPGSSGKDYFILVDKYKTGKVVDKSGTATWKTGEQKVGVDEYGNDITGHWAINQNLFEAEKQITDHQPEDAPNTQLILDNTMILARKDINFEIASIRGDNALMQVEGSIFMRSGKLSAGQDIGAVIYCNNFYCGCNGDFKGVIMVTQSMKVGAPVAGNTTLHVQGGVAIKGDDPPVPPPGSSTRIFDKGGLVATGFEIVYDPYYMRFLNRFGRFRTACWIDRD
jgi:hypothetical protein